MSSSITLICLATILVIMVTTAEAKVNCSQQDGGYYCYKTGSQQPVPMMISCRVDKPVKCSYRVYKYNCNGGGGKDMVKQEEDVMVQPNKPRQVMMPATDGKMCAYMQMYGCSVGGKKMSCSQALKAQPKGGAGTGGQWATSFIYKIFS